MPTIRRRVSLGPVALVVLFMLTGCLRSDESLRGEVAATLGAAQGWQQIVTALESRYSDVTHGSWSGHGGVASLRHLDYRPCHDVRAVVEQKRRLLINTAVAIILVDCEGRVKDIFIEREVEGL
jgi:hypothetical protein